MLNVSDDFRTAMTSPVRNFVAEVKMQEDEANPDNISTYTHIDRIKKVEIQRVGDNSKFFGFGVCQRLNLKMVDLPDSIQPISKSSFKVKIGITLPDESVEYVSYPTFYLTEKNRAEEDGDISLTAYDKIYELSNHTVSELELTVPYTIKDFIQACADVIGLEVAYENLAEDDFMLMLSYEEGANFEGTENLRNALNAAAEATQTIYFVDYDDKLKFKRLDVSGEPVATITPEDYFSFSHSDNKRLIGVAHTTELGDNVSVETSMSGTVQYVRDNPFWELREDIATIVETATDNVYLLTVHQFDADWRGFPLLEIGDKISLEQVVVNGKVENSFIFDDTITYDGGFSEKSQWTYQNSDAETETNVSNIGDAINMTFAKVDKINQTITLQAADIQANSEKIGAIQINTTSISQSVKEVQKSLDESIEGINNELASITESVSQTITKDSVKTIVEDVIEENGVKSVKTTTGTFDEDGLLIEKSTSDMSTRISEDGMTVYRNDEAVLVANNQGVEAMNIHVRDYLSIGTNSRFEDYDGNRTGCFYIGS